MTRIKNNILESFNGYIFDIDGTMIDSMKVHMKAWQKTLERYGRPMSLKEVGKVAYGINPEIVKRALGNDLTQQEVEKISDEKEVLFRESFEPEEDVIKGFIHFIDKLKMSNARMVIGTAAPPENVKYFMDKLGIADYFEGVIHEDDVSKGKPSPEVFIKAAQILGVPNEECVVFEDSPSGAKASAKAGSKTIAVLSSKAESDFKDIPHVVGYIRDYTELLE